MKKVSLSPRRQQRRLAALERFTIDTERAARDPEYAQRKEQEQRALHERLGTKTR